MLHNPYLILLLKKLILWEYGWLYSHSPTQHDLEDFFTEKEGGHRPAHAIGSYIKKWWSKQDFEIDVFYLDVIARSIKNLADYKSWEDFQKKEGKGAFWRAGEELSSKKFEDLDKRSKQLLDVMAQKRCAEIFFDFGRARNDITSWYEKKKQPYERQFKSWEAALAYFLDTYGERSWNAF